MLEEKLKNLIIDKYGSVRQFSFKIDIPYTTVDSILKRGIDNSNVGNVIKMCKALNISIDNLLDNKEIISNFNNNITNQNDTIKTSSKNDGIDNMMSQYRILFDKDTVLTNEQKKFFIDFLEEKHREIDKKTEKN